MSDTMLAALGDAWDKAEGGADEAPEAEAVSETPEPPDEQPEGEGHTTPEGEDAAPPERARAEDGRFAKVKPEGKPAAATPKPPPQPKAAAPSPQAGKTPAVAAKSAAHAPIAPPSTKAPATLPPAVREAWPKLPRETQDYMLKREGEVARTLAAAAETRKTAEAFQRVVEPYRALIPGDPARAVGDLLGTAAVLKTGTPYEKAQVAATILQQYGVDLGLVNQHLEGKAPAAQPQAPAEFRDPRFDAFLAQQRQQQDAHLSSAIQDFAAKNEFFADLEQEMTGLIQSGLAKGNDIATRLQQAYNKALAVHRADPESEIGKVLRSREAAQRASKESAAAQRARHAASSVRSQPAPPPSGKPATLQDELSQRWDELSR